MEQIDEEINYYLKHGITQHEDDIVKNRQESGEDVDAEIWEATYCDCNKEVSFRKLKEFKDCIVSGRNYLNWGISLKMSIRKLFYQQHNGMR